MTSFRSRLLLSFCVLAWLCCGRARADVPDDLRTSLVGQGHALLIGVSRYDNAAWPTLTSVPGDIAELAAGLRPHFATVETLQDATADEIRARLRAFMTGAWNRPNERLLIYYAGHGFTDFNPNSRVDNGYLTGRDTPACKGGDCGNAVGQAVPFQEIDALNREARARQVIVLFDSCFSGTVFLTRAPGFEPRHFDYQRARDAIQSPVRYYITAGGANETIPARSPFAALVLRGLSGEADIYGDGFITGEELGAYLQRNVPKYAGVMLHPQKGTIADTRLSAGQFLFLTDLRAVASAPATPTVSSPTPASSEPQATSDPKVHVFELLKAPFSVTPPNQAAQPAPAAVASAGTPLVQHPTTLLAPPTANQASPAAVIHPTTRYSWGTIIYGDATIEDLRRKVQAEPRNPDAWSDLGELLMKNGQYDEGVDALKRASQLPPKEIGRAYLFRDLAEALDERGSPGDLDAALDASQKSLHMWPVSTGKLYCSMYEVELLFKLLRKKGDQAGIDSLQRTCIDK